MSNERFKRIGAQLQEIDEKLVCPKCGGFPLQEQDFNFLICPDCEYSIIRNNDATIGWKIDED